MNLIEQLGGHEKAKAELKDKRWRKDNLHGSSEFTWHMEQHIKLLEAVLLQYRRQHNIFEVGDKVVSKYENLNLFGDVVLEIEYFRKLSSVVWVRFTNENDYRVDALRHATDAEIAAGRRL